MRRCPPTVFYHFHHLIFGQSRFIHAAGFYLLEELGQQIENQTYLHLACSNPDMNFIPDKGSVIF